MLVRDFPNPEANPPIGYCSVHDQVQSRIEYGKMLTVIKWQH